MRTYSLGCERSLSRPAHRVLTVAVGFNEEIWFRGLSQAVLRVRGTRYAVVWGSVLFGVLHLASLLMEILPLDPQRRAAELQGAAFAERAAFDPTIGDAIAASDRELRAALVGLLQREQREGRLQPDLDADAAAWIYWTIAEGMATQLLYDPLTEEQALARVRWAVDALFD